MVSKPDIPADLITRIETDLGPANKLFKGEYTLLVQAAVKHGFGVVLGDLISKVYLGNKGIKDLKVIEGILSAAMYHCENNYCYILHSAWLLNHGLSFEKITHLTQTLTFPEEVDDHEKWTMILKLTFYTSKDRGVAIDNLKAISQLLTEAELQHYTSIVSLAKFLEFLLTSFHDEINVDDETLFRDESTGGLKRDISDFVKFYWQKKKEDADSDEQIPIFVICSFCKDIRDKNDKWYSFEELFSQLPSNAGFSHGMCPTCLDVQLKRINSKRAS
ncbi:MAG: hypothetical protein AAFX87_00160 [Bacteroidota bacterium]